MRNFFRYLGISATISLTVMAIQSCSKISGCEIQTQQPQNASVQLNDSIYNQVFGKKSCSPKSLTLRLPVNSSTENTDKKLNSHKYTPKIITLVTFSNEYESLSIKRIDKYADSWIYSQKDACLAWIWKASEENDKQKKLILSMERNLRIHDPKIKSIIFIVSLPLEIIENQVNITLKRYTLNTSRIGKVHHFKLGRQFPELKDLLRQQEKGRFRASNKFFNEGKKVSQKIAEELESINNQVGVYLEEDLNSLLDAEYKETYSDRSESSYCEIPTNFKNHK